LRIQIVTPADKGSNKGNRVAAERWARMLRDLGHRVSVDAGSKVRDADVLIAMHARKTVRATRAFSAAHPERPIVVVLTGTDLYGDLPKRDPNARWSIRRADRLVVLQTHALEVLPKRAADKARVIPQSVPEPQRQVRPRVRTFDICVVGHMRYVKDPMRAAMAARRLPAASRIAVLHAGGAIEARYEKRAREEMEKNSRYRWLGELSRRKSMRLIQRSRALVVSSRMEGGAHATSEALVAGTPILASRISGNIGMLGEDYPALFDVGDTAALTDLMRRFETEEQFRDRLDLWCRLLAPAYTPERERFALRALLAELF
jgi:putative glycosyltransferase (TIGR04348 family)